jgi:hypothetical protein
MYIMPRWWVHTLLELGIVVAIQALVIRTTFSHVTFSHNDTAVARDILSVFFSVYANDEASACFIHPVSVQVDRKVVASS